MAGSEARGRGTDSLCFPVTEKDVSAVADSYWNGGTQPTPAGSLPPASLTSGKRKPIYPSVTAFEKWWI